MRLKPINKNQVGFGHLETLVLLIVISIIGFGAWRVLNHKTKNPITASSYPAGVNQDPGVTPSADFNVVGNKIIGPNGKQFVPYGTIIECASERKPASLCQGQGISGNTGTAQINAAAKYWNMNILRFQVAQEHLFNSNGSINYSYLNLIDGLVKQTNSLGMVAIITLQEEHYDGPAFPTSTATTFWKFMAQHYKGYPDVFFDLYNEPRLPADALLAGSNIWDIWQNGGNAYFSSGANATTNKIVQYVGMQSLVNTIREQGAKNIIIAEGPNYDQDLSELPTHLLTGGNIAYGIEPNLWRDTTQTSQYNTFGQDTKNWPIMPEAFLDNEGTHFCDPNSPVDLPSLLAYLKSLNMGLLFWALVPGDGIVGHNLDQPTSYPAGASSISSPTCPHRGSKSVYVPNNTIGDGSLIMSFYKANSVRL